MPLLQSAKGWLYTQGPLLQAQWHKDGVHASQSAGKGWSLLGGEDQHWGNVDSGHLYYKAQWDSSGNPPTDLCPYTCTRLPRRRPYAFSGSLGSGAGTQEPHTAVHPTQSLSPHRQLILIEASCTGKCSLLGRALSPFGSHLFELDVSRLGGSRNSSLWCLTTQG